MKKQVSDRTNPVAKVTDDEQLRKDLDERLRRVDALPTIDPRPGDEIVDYDAGGIPN
jgi:hypothetical protein